MTANHLHLVAVHVPVVLMPLAFVLLAIGWWKGRPSSSEASSASAATLLATGRSLIVVSAVVGGVAYYTGPIAFESLETELEAARDLVELHAVIGRAAFFGLILLVVPTVQAVVREIQEEPRSRALDATVIGGAALISYLMLWTGHYGGAIRRPEIAGVLGWIFPSF
ncbi:MAG: hypothetical protein AAF389_06575 [Gemmatimonadota bacterium]